MFHVACTGPTPGFDPVGSLLKSSWVKERQAKRQQARWQPAALVTAKGQAPRSSRAAGPGRAPAGQHEARERAMAAQQARAKQPAAAGLQPQLSQVGRRIALLCNHRLVLYCNRRSPSKTAEMQSYLSINQSKRNLCPGHQQGANRPSKYSEVSNNNVYGSGVHNVLTQYSWVLWLIRHQHCPKLKQIIYVQSIA